jgi:hypothetical protein
MIKQSSAKYLVFIVVVIDGRRNIEDIILKQIMTRS